MKGNDSFCSYLRGIMETSMIYPLMLIAVDVIVTVVFAKFTLLSDTSN